MKKFSLRTWIIRVLLLLFGLTIAHLGVTLFLQSAMGSDPFNVMIQGLYRFIPWPESIPVTHGWVHVGISFLIILVLLIVDRSYVRIGAFLCMILGGPIIDGFTFLVKDFIHAESPMGLRIAAMAVGCIILSFGMTTAMKSQAGLGPNDLVGLVISEKTKWKFGIVRIAVDVIFAGSGFLLGGTLGVGTIICAFLVGPTAQIFMPICEKMCNRFLQQPEVSAEQK